TGVAASLSYGGTLDAEPQDDQGEARSYDLPFLVRAGASGRIGQNTLLAVSGSWNGWSSLNEALGDVGGARDSWSAHAGFEWDGASIRNRPIPFRIGARTGALPFRW